MIRNIYVKERDYLIFRPTFLLWVDGQEVVSSGWARDDESMNAQQGIESIYDISVEKSMRNLCAESRWSKCLVLGSVRIGPSARNEWLCRSRS